MRVVRFGALRGRRTRRTYEASSSPHLRSREDKCIARCNRCIALHSLEVSLRLSDTEKREYAPLFKHPKAGRTQLKGLQGGHSFGGCGMALKRDGAARRARFWAS